MSSPAPDPSLSKSALKKKAKAVAAQQPSASESESGVAAVAPAAGVEDESKASTSTTGGPGSVVIVKRIKVLAKKVQRVTSYKEIPTEKLNPDQVLALSRLEGIKATLTELEEVKKAVEVAELEQAATLRAQKTAEAANDSQTPETAAVAAPSTSSSVTTVLSFLRLNSVVFPASNGGFAPSQDTPEVVKQLSGQEGAAIGKIAYALLGAGGEEVAQKLVAGGEEEVLEGVTYAKVLSLAQDLAASPAAHTASTSAPVFAPFSPRVAPSTSDVPDVPIQFGSLNDSTSLPPPPVPTKTAGNTDPWKETPSAAAPPPITSKPLAFGTAMTGGADLNDFDEPDLEMEIQTDAVGDAGREGEGEGLAPVDEDKVSSTETPAAPAPASPAVQATINGPEPAGIAIQPPPKTKIDWADTSSLGSLPPIPSFGGTVNIAALSASPLAPKSASPANSKTLSAPSNAASTSAPRAPQVQRGWGPSATSSRNSTPPASSSMTTPPSDQTPSTPTSTLNRPNHSFSAQRTGPLPPPFVPRAQQQAQAAAAAAAAAPTNAPLQDEDGFQSVGGRKSRTENNWRSAGGDSNRGGGRGGYRGGRGGGEGGGRGRGGSRGRGGYKGGNADK